MAKKKLLVVGIVSAIILIALLIFFSDSITGAFIALPGPTHLTEPTIGEEVSQEPEQIPPEAEELTTPTSTDESSMDEQITEPKDALENLDGKQPILPLDQKKLSPGVIIADNDSWPKFQRDLNNSGYASSVSLVPTSNTTIWSVSLDGAVDDPIIFNSTVYVSGFNALYALNLSNGSTIWINNFTTGYRPDYAPLISDNIIYSAISYSTPTSTVSLCAINATNLTQIWNYTSPGQTAGSPSANSGMVYHSSTSGGNVYALNATNGTPVWEFNLSGGQFFSSIAINNDRLYIGSENNKSVHVLNATNGTNIWSYYTNNGVYSTPSVCDDIVYFGEGVNITASNATNGTLIWNYVASGVVISSPAIVNNVVYCGANDNKLYALNATNGTKIWEYSTAGIVRESPAVAGKVLFVGSYDDKIYAINITSGTKIWDYTTGDNIDSSAAIISEIVVIGSNDGKVYCFGDTDTQAPTVTSITPTDNFYHKDAVGNIVFKYNATDNNNVSNCSLILGGAVNLTNANINMNASHAFSLVNVSSGIHIWSIDCNDSSANKGSSNNRTVTIMTMPNITIIGPADGSTDGDGTFTVQYNVTDNLNVDNCSLIIDSSASTTDTSITMDITQELITILTDGDYDWSINCTDNTGNTENSSTRTITVAIQAVLPSSGGQPSGSGSGGFTTSDIVEDVEEGEEPPSYVFVEPGTSYNQKENTITKIVSQSQAISNIKIKLKESADVPLRSKITTVNKNIFSGDANGYSILSRTDISSNIPNTDIEEVKIKYKVPNILLSDERIAVNQIFTTRNGERVETNKIDSDESYTYFEVVSPGFSEFAMFGVSIPQIIIDMRPLQISLVLLVLASVLWIITMGWYSKHPVPIHKIDKVDKSVHIDMVHDYIEECKSRGFSEDEIKAALLKSGWKKEDVTKELGTDSQKR